MTLNDTTERLNALAKEAYARIRATDSFPSPSGVAKRVLQLVNDEEATIEALATLLETDPAIAARILRFANSPIVGAPRKIASVSGAVRMLGLRTVRSLVLGISMVFAPKRVRCEGFAFDPFWSESVACAAAARRLAITQDAIPPDDAFTCGLLSQIGRLAFATTYRTEYAKVLRQACGGGPGALAVFERGAFEIDHTNLAAEMMNDWGIPSAYCEAVRRQDNPDAPGLEPESLTVRMARVLGLAGAVAVVLVDPAPDLLALNAMIGDAGALRISPDDFHVLFDAVGLEWREAAAIFGVSGRKQPPLAILFERARAAWSGSSGTE